MRTRFITVFGVSLVFVVGALAVADRINVAQAPVSPVASEPPVPVPAAPVPAVPAPAPQPAAPAPVVTVPMPPAKPATAEEKLPAKLLFSKKELPSLGKAM